MGSFMMIFDFDFESDLFESPCDDQGCDRLVVTDRDRLTHQRDMDVCCGDGQLIIQCRLDSEDAAWTVKIIDDKVRDLVHISRDAKWR